MTSNESAINLINKLLAKANDLATTEEEAAAFASKAAELLARHNLDIADLQGSNPASDFARAASDFKYISPLWRELAAQVAGYYFCKCVITSRWDEKKGRAGGIREQFEFFGREHNVQVAVSMFSYLTKTIIRMMQRYSKDRKEQLQFERGCCRGMSNRLYQLRKAASTANSDGSGNSVSGVAGLPALYENESVLVKNYVDQVLGALKKVGRGATVYNNAAVMAGSAAAQNISLNTQVDSGNKGPLLLK